MNWAKTLLIALLVTGSAMTIQNDDEQDENDVVPPVLEPIPFVPAAPAVDTALLELAADLMIPVQGVAVRNLHDNFHQLRGTRMHDAIDILAPEETPVRSATAGRVLQLQKNGRGGRMVFATDSSERFILLYAHLDDYAEGLKQGVPLARGQLLGYVGTSGNARRRAPHLHFAIKRVDGGLRWSHGTAINPYPLLVQSPPAGGLGKRVAEQAR